MSILRPVMLISLITCSLTVALAQNPQIDPDQKYLLLATTRTSTMQKELDAAAAQGFRIVAGSPTSGAEMVILLERTAKAPNTYKYKLLATNQTGTMQKELDAAAAEGYQLLPRTMIAKQQVFIGPEIVVVLEKAPQSSTRYQYRLLATSRTSTMQKEILQAINDGFQIAGIASRGEHMVIMEKKTGGEEAMGTSPPAATEPKKN